jgi:hypothetical protein
MALVLFLGGVLGWFVYRVRKQHEAVVAIQRAGGWVVYQWRWKNGRLDRFGQPGVPRWLLDRLGPDFFYRVKRVDIVGGFGGQADDNLMTQVACLGDLEALNLDGSKDVTDVGLADLEDLTQLLYLHLSESGVRDDGLAHLKGLRNLRTLDLNNTEVTDAGLAHLSGLSNLQELCLNGTIVTSVEVREFAEEHPNTRIEPSELQVSTTGP